MNNREFLALLVICNIPLSDENPIFGPPGEKSFWTCKRMLVSTFSCFLEQIISWSLKVTRLWSFILQSPLIWVPKVQIYSIKPNCPSMCAARGNIFWFWRFTPVDTFSQIYFGIIFQSDRSISQTSFLSKSPWFNYSSIQPPTLRRYVRHEWKSLTLYLIFHLQRADLNSI